MNIHGKKVVLRSPEPADAELLHQWANDPAIWSLLAGWHFPYGSRSTERWLEAVDNTSLKQHVFAIEAPGLGLIGTANLTAIDWKNRNAHHGMMLGDKDIRGKGYGLDTVMAIMRYAFEELGLKRLDGDMIEYNQRSLDFYLKSCGWVVEGRKRAWHFRHGRFWDKIVVGITDEDYAALIARTNYWDS